MGGAHYRRFHRFEDGGPLRIEVVKFSRAGKCELIIGSSEEPRADLKQGSVSGASRFNIHLHPDARIAALVHAVVAQPRMAAQRDAMERGAGVCFGCGRVLGIGELVADIGKELGDSDRKIGAGSLRPIGHEEPKAVEQHTAKALVIPGKIVDARRRRWFGGACRDGPAVELGRTGRLERKSHAREPRVKAGGRLVAFPLCDQGKGVYGEIAGSIHRDGENVTSRRNADGAEILDPLATKDPNVFGGQSGSALRYPAGLARQWMNEMEFQFGLRFIGDFKEIDAVKERSSVRPDRRAHAFAAVLIAAEEHGIGEISGSHGRSECALELYCLRLGLITQREDDFYDEPVVLGFEIEGDQFYQVAEPLLEGRLGGNAHGFRQQIAVRSEDGMMEAASETRAVDALTRRGKKDLLEQVANVPCGIRGCAPAVPLCLKRKIDVHRSIWTCWLEAGHILHSKDAGLRRRDGNGTLGRLLGALANSNTRVEERRLSVNKDPAGRSELRSGDTRLWLAGNVERTSDNGMDVARLGGRLSQEEDTRAGAGNRHLAAVRAHAFGEGLDESSRHNSCSVDYITTSAPALTMT